jgi:hypothetical protein
MALIIFNDPVTVPLCVHGMLPQTPMIFKEMGSGADMKSSMQLTMHLDWQLSILISKLSESKGCTMDELRSFEAANM